MSQERRWKAWSQGRRWKLTERQEEQLLIWGGRGSEWQAVSQECFQEGEGRASASRAWGSTEGLEQSGEVERLLSRDRRATQGPGSDPSFIPAVCCSVT